MNGVNNIGGTGAPQGGNGPIPPKSSGGLMGLVSGALDAVSSWVATAVGESLGGRVTNESSAAPSSGQAKLIEDLKDPNMDKAKASLAKYVRELGKDDTHLGVAVSYGSVELVKSLIVDKVNINEIDGEGRTALTLAINNADEAMVQALIEGGANVNFAAKSDSTSNLRTPLLHAILKGNNNIVKMLLDKGAKAKRLEINGKDKDGRTALMMAVDSGNKQIVDTLIELKADVNLEAKSDPTSDKSTTPLLHAISKGNADVIETLVKAGADINKKDKDGRTALMMAVDIGNIDMVNTLIRLGADLNLAAKGASESIPTTPLIKAVKKENTEIIKALIDGGANPDRANRERETPRNLSKGKSNQIQELIPPQAKSNKTIGSMVASIGQMLTGKTTTKTSMATFQLNKLLKNNPSSVTNAMIKEALDKGLNLNEKDEKGRTLLHNVILSNRTDLIAVLLENGSDVNALDGDGNTPLQLVLQNKEMEDGDILLGLVALQTAGADFHAKDSQGRTPLHNAIRLGVSANVLQSLIEVLSKDGSGTLGLDEIDDKGRTLLEYAIRKNDLNTVKLLVENRADVNLANRKGQNPLDFAGYVRGAAIRKFLIEKRAKPGPKKPWGIV